MDTIRYQRASSIRRQHKQNEAFSGIERVGYRRVPPKKQGFWSSLAKAGDNLAAHPELFGEQPKKGRKNRPPKNNYSIENLI